MDNENYDYGKLYFIELSRIRRNYVLSARQHLIAARDMSPRGDYVVEPLQELISVLDTVLEILDVTD